MQGHVWRRGPFPEPYTVQVHTKSRGVSLRLTELGKLDSAVPALTEDSWQSRSYSTVKEQQIGQGGRAAPKTFLK